MNKTKKIAVSLATLSLIILPFAAMAYTAQPEPTATSFTVTGIISKVVMNVWYVFAAIAVIMFVYAGVTFLTAGGAPEKIATARSAAIWGVVGVIVMILAYAIFNIATKLIS